MKNDSINFITKEQAEKAVNNFIKNGFGMIRPGFFDLSFNEMVVLLQLAFRANGENECKNYREYLSFNGVKEN